MKIGGGLITLVVIVLVAIWAGSKWPQLNLIGKLTGG
jgi:hypothetical protein